MTAPKPLFCLLQLFSVSFTSHFLSSMSIYHFWIIFILSATFPFFLLSWCHYLVLCVSFMFSSSLMLSLSPLSGLEGNRPADARFFADPGNAVQFGSPVLLQNVQEELDPSLAPILNKSLTRVGQSPLTHTNTHMIHHWLITSLNNQDDRICRM